MKEKQDKTAAFIGVNANSLTSTAAGTVAGNSGIEFVCIRGAMDVLACFPVPPFSLPSMVARQVGFDPPPPYPGDVSRDEVGRQAPILPLNSHRQEGDK
ncbi:hypothetical protein CEXT_259611 [Caerostris extrusa]|uniref:Uncharacterized protein n=1 Tax=Caerostris extrusa TaxID=172846 RepID=A0AAV4VG33_CAEEX|nr:hypothetical protein CEXT_259611 [Caerostris extrusa]